VRARFDFGSVLVNGERMVDCVSGTFVADVVLAPMVNLLANRLRRNVATRPNRREAIFGPYFLGRHPQRLAFVQSFNL
jgi:hypothetical protein